MRRKEFLVAAKRNLQFTWIIFTYFFFAFLRANMKVCGFFHHTFPRTYIMAKSLLSANCASEHLFCIVHQAMNYKILFLFFRQRNSQSCTPQFNRTQNVQQVKRECQKKLIVLLRPWLCNSKKEWIVLKFNSPWWNFSDLWLDFSFYNFLAISISAQFQSGASPTLKDLVEGRVEVGLDSGYAGSLKGPSLVKKKLEYATF